MFNNNFNGAQQMGYGIPQGTGYQYTGNPQPIKIQNNLSDDEIQHLIKNENTFSLMLTNEEKLRACCNHRWPNGTDAITETPDGKCRCQICGYEFIPLDANINQGTLQEYVDNILDVLQTIKILYLNMPAESAREFFVIIPLIEKIPRLFELAVKNWAKYENFDPYRFNDKNMGTMALFNMLAASLNNGAGFVQQPQQTAQQPMGGMPQMNMGQMPPYGMGYAQPMSNGFGYNGAPGYMPQMNNFQYDPMAQQAQMQGQAQAQPGQTAAETAQATTDGSTVAVDANFKA